MKKNQNKIMISEVNRIKELMGIRKKIFEAASGEPATILEKFYTSIYPISLMTLNLLRKEMFIN